MAIYHFSARTGSRQGGQSAAAKFDYIARQGKSATNGDKVVHVLNGNLPAWAQESPRSYWNAADLYERANGRLFKEIDIALPRELNHGQRVDLAEAFARKITTLPVGTLPFVLALHEGKATESNPGNPHFHIAISERVNDGHARKESTWFGRAAVGKGKQAQDGGAAKTDLLKPEEWLMSTRELWADMCNEALLNAGSVVRIDHRSLKDQGIDRPAPVHLGPQVCAFEQRTGQISWRRRESEERALAQKLAIRALEEEIEVARENERVAYENFAREAGYLAELEREAAEELENKKAARAAEDRRPAPAAELSLNGFDCANPLKFSKVYESDFYKIKEMPSGARLHLRMPVDRVVFVEHKHHIRMSKTDAMSRESVAEAIKVACEKWGTIKVTGSDEFKQLVIETATELGLSHLISQKSAPLPAPSPLPPTRF